VEKSKIEIIAKLKELKGRIEKNDFSDFEFKLLCSFQFDRHLYKPLVHVGKSWSDILKVMPMALNEGEKDFVQNLKAYYEKKPEAFKNRDLYLLRNLGRGHGVGFFQANNFYPDFILWLVDGNKQYIAFVDPKGLLMIEEEFDHPKVRFFREIKEIEKQIGDPNVTLNSFIVSVTPYRMGLWGTTNPDEFEAHHVYFQTEKGIYIEKIIQKMRGDI